MGSGESPGLDEPPSPPPRVVILGGLAIARLVVSRKIAISAREMMIFHLHFLSTIETTSLHFID